MRKKGLTPKQEKFATEYIVDMNATQACIRAGYSAKNADKIGSQLLGNSRVMEAIKAARERQVERTEITEDYVLKGLQREAETMGKGGSPSARVRALELLGKHRDMFREKVDVNVKAQLEVSEVVIRSRKQAEEILSDLPDSGRIPGQPGTD